MRERGDVTGRGLASEGGVSGRRLLVLGAGGVTTGSEASVVRFAHEMGVRVTVTDNRLNWDDAPAKRVADEAWDVSWSDVDELERHCLREGIDGVFAGFSEQKVACAARLCRRLGLPFYTEGADLRTIFNKALFYAACERAGVPVPRRFPSPGEVGPNDYPVVVKPVDGAGSAGVSVCAGPEDLGRALCRARRTSPSGEALMEELLPGDEAFFYYLVVEGRACVVGSCDLVALDAPGIGLRLPTAIRYPSVNADMFMRRDDAAYRRLIADLGIRNGIIGFQCLMRDGHAVVHDPTFRADGSAIANVMHHDTGTNAIKLIIHHSLTGRLGPEADVERLTDPSLRTAQLYLGVMLRPGTVAGMTGERELMGADGLIFARQTVSVGDVIDPALPVYRRVAYSVGLSAPDYGELERRIARLNDRVRVWDVDGEDMVVRVDPHEFVSSGLIAFPE